MRKFEKISFIQFKKDVKDDIDLYKSFTVPSRSTKNSAGYDFVSLYDFQILPNEVVKIPLGIKVSMNSDEVLLIVDRSSVGFKYNVRLVNQVGVIDSDYYNNIDNEGHIWLKLHNHGDKTFMCKKGEKICQGIFVKYLTVDDEKNIENERVSGIGSTN